MKYEEAHSLSGASDTERDKFLARLEASAKKKEYTLDQLYSPSVGLPWLEEATDQY